MNKRHGVRAGLALVTLTGTVAAAGAVAAADGPVGHDSASRGHQQVIELVAEEADDEVLDLGEPGFGLGDQLVIADLLTRQGKKVGTSDGTCQITRFEPPKLTVNCVTTLALPGGQVAVQGSLDVGGGADHFIAAVTGGTGTYRSAHGEMVIAPVDADTEVYRLTIIR